MNALNNGPLGMLMEKPQWASVVALSMGIVLGVVTRNMDLIHNHTRRRLPKWVAASSSFWGFRAPPEFLETSPLQLMIGGIVIESSGSVSSGPSRGLPSFPCLDG